MCGLSPRPLTSLRRPVPLTHHARGPCQAAAGCQAVPSFHFFQGLKSQGKLASPWLCVLSSWVCDKDSSVPALGRLPDLSSDWFRANPPSEKFGVFGKVQQSR